jgi:hypothetical protein
LIGALSLYDAYRSTKHDGSTLSACIRRVVRTDTPAGQAIFLLGLATFARHILH